MDFAIDTGFANAAGDQLRVLGTEIEDQNFLLMNIQATTRQAKNEFK